jgi:hypothetical protein
MEPATSLFGKRFSLFGSGFGAVTDINQIRNYFK